MNNNKLKSKEYFRDKTIFGFGVNDSIYTISWFNSEGKKILCPYYRKWYEMVRRCYSDGALKRMPSYMDCYVCEEWKLFSNFKSWMETQDWEDKVLDKDILIRGNKCYSAETCCFVPEYINLVLVSFGKNKGVSYNKKSRKFYAVIRTNGVKSHLGSFDSEDEAINCYLDAKKRHLKSLVKIYSTSNPKKEITEALNKLINEIT